MREIRPFGVSVSPEIKPRKVSAKNENLLRKDLDSRFTDHAIMIS